MTSTETAAELMKSADWVSANPQLWDGKHAMRSTLQAMIRDAIDCAVSAEREACARIAEEYSSMTGKDPCCQGISSAIRMRTTNDIRR